MELCDFGWSLKKRAKLDEIELTKELFYTLALKDRNPSPFSIAKERIKKGEPK